MTKKLKNGKHGKMSMLELIKLMLLKLCRGKVWLALQEVSKEAIIVHSSNGEEHLGPAKRRNGINGSDTIRDVCEGKARGNLTGPVEDLPDDVADNSKLGNTSVLELSGMVLVKSLLVNVAGQSQWIEESSRGDDAKLILVRHLEGHGGLAGLGRGECGGTSNEGGQHSKLHLNLLFP